MSGIKKGAGSRYGYPHTIPALHSSGFHPRSCGSPECDNPRTGTTSSSLSAQGRYGGTGTVPSFVVPVRCRSYQK